MDEPVDPYSWDKITAAELATLIDKGVTKCQHCDHVHPETRGKAPYLWRCLKHPRITRVGWVTEDGYDDGNAPYLRCQDVNGGLCLLFEPKREPPE